MYELEQLVERSWMWLERTGGYPGKMMFISLLVTVMVGTVSWYSGRR